MIFRPPVVSLLMVVPVALLVVLGVLGCNRDATRRLGYAGLIEVPGLPTHTEVPRR